ncbi:unnamed protein product [Cyprideis torosa]|uniref:Uncharacterized protein n=1 Tax=Cyprideis torosa TaxID=163714 RepID=A0A7R8WA42_9CRUS|nr:unnamed protein product [Cyprideis torosa]CAG0889219.1 unnamed protein product [Cyprideis torosa]
MDRVVILFSAVLVLFVCCSSGSNVASSIVDPENDVRELSKPGKYKCALYFMGPLTKPEGAAYLRTVPLDLDAECSNGRVASESLRQKYARKCRDLVNTGLKGEYALNKPSPAKDVNGTIGDYWCQKVIGRNGCGFQYAVFLSTCGGPMEDTGLRGPEPICCKYDRDLSTLEDAEEVRRRKTARLRERVADPNDVRLSRSIQLKSHGDERLRRLQSNLLPRLNDQEDEEQHPPSPPTLKPQKLPTDDEEEGRRRLNLLRRLPKQRIQNEGRGGERHKLLQRIRSKWLEPQFSQRFPISKQQYDDET